MNKPITDTSNLWLEIFKVVARNYSELNSPSDEFFIEHTNKLYEAALKATQPTEKDS